MIKIVERGLSVILLPFAFCALLCNNLMAQEFSKDMWHEGEIDLLFGKERQTLRGKLKYSLEEETVQVIAVNTIKTYNAQDIEAFQIFDAKYEIVRFFFSLPYGTTKKETFEKKHLFELLLDDEYSLLARERIVERINNQFNPDWGMSRPVRSFEQVDDFFLMDAKGRIKYVDIKSIDTTLDAMKDRYEALRKYIKTNKMRIARRPDMMRIVDHYNKLKQGKITN